jgi:mono/diheme cytochrome c family protein
VLPGHSGSLTGVIPNEKDGRLMKNNRFFIMLMVLPAAVLLWSTAVSGKDDGQGRKIYNEKCQFCHGIKGDGKGPAAASMNPRPDDFNDPQFWKRNDEKKISETIEKGHGMMPAFDMKPDEIKAVMDYISDSFKRRD